MDMKMNDVVLPWPEWKVEKLLGRGSFGEVYQVVRDEFGTSMHAAIKIIRIPRDSAEIEELKDSGISARSYLNGLVHDITNEIVLMQTLKGAPNIVGIDDYKIIESTEQVQWTIYIRMELLTDLNCYRREHPLSYKEVIQLGCDLCNALEICRKKNIIHRDIKPSNIFVSPYGEYKLGDFGISKHTDNTQSAFSTRRGTYSYMAPEVYCGEKYGYSIDIYSLGVVLYQLANNGRLPFYPPAEKDVLPGDAALALEKRNKGLPFPDPANGGEQLGNILRKACHIDPRKRYASPETLHEDLRKLLYSEESSGRMEEADDETVWMTAPKKTEGAGKPEKLSKTTKPQSPPKSQKEKPVSRNHYKVMVWTAVVLLGIGTAGILVSLYGSRNIKKESLMAMKANPEPITESGSEIAAESDKETEMGTEEQTEAGSEAELKAETEEQTEAGSEAESKAETEEQTEAGTEAESKAETEEQTEAGMEAESKAETEEQTEAGMEAESKAETEEQTEARTEAETEGITEKVTEAVTEMERITESATETAAETVTEKAEEPAKEAKNMIVSVEAAGKKNDIEICNHTDVKMAKLLIYEAAETEKAAEITSEEIQKRKKWEVMAEKGKVYRLVLEGEDSSDRLTFYNVSLEDADEIDLCQKDDYTYVSYIKDGQAEENAEKYRIKSYNTNVKKYVLADSGLNVRNLPDDKAGAVVEKIALASEIEVCGEAKGLIRSEESDWYLIKVDGQYGYISANNDYTTDDKGAADRKKEEVLAARAAAAAAQQQQTYSGSGGTSGGSSGGWGDIIPNSW